MRSSFVNIGHIAWRVLLRNTFISEKRDRQVKREIGKEAQRKAGKHRGSREAGHTTGRQEKRGNKNSPFDCSLLQR